LNVLNGLNGLDFFKPWTHMSLLGVDSYTPKSENYPNLGALCAFAGDTSSEFFSRQDAKLAKAPRRLPTFFRGPYLDFSELGEPFDFSQDMLCAFARGNSFPFPPAKYATTESCYLLTRTMQRKPRWQVEVSMGWGMRAAGR
jgi:hypothetical protein